MSDVLDRIRRELQQRLESTRAAAQEHERVRAALEALEHAVKPLEEVTRRAASGASQRGRRVAARARASSPVGSATTESDAATASPSSRGPNGPAACRRLAEVSGHRPRSEGGFWIDGEGWGRRDGSGRGPRDREARPRACASGR